MNALSLSFCLRQRESTTLESKVEMFNTDEKNNFYSLLAYEENIFFWVICISVLGGWGGGDH